MQKSKFHRQLPLHIMLLPALLLLAVYSYLPMLGLVMAFQKYVPALGFFRSEWVGLDNFTYIFSLPDFKVALFNTFFIATMKMIAGLIVPVTIALLLNEVGFTPLKRVMQTVVYFPHFLSWVVLSAIFIDVLSPSTGILAQIIALFGINPPFFLGDNQWFPYVLVITDVWKEFGFGTIVYLAAITSISPELYEASLMDGANRWKQTLHVTLPGMIPIIVLMATLSLGNVLNAGFDQVYNLYSPVVYNSGDIIDTLVYRIGFIESQYSVGTAIGLFKSLVSTTMISLSYYLAYKFTKYRIF